MMNASNLTNKSPLSALTSAGRWRLFARACVVAIVLLLGGCASLVRPNFETETGKLRAGEYVIDPNHTFVIFRINHLGLSDVIGRFNDIEASLSFDPDTPEAMQLDGRIATASIDLGNEEFEDQLRGGAWLDSEQHPFITFTTNTVAVEPSGDLTIEGDISLRGVTRTLALQARFNGGADNLLTGKYTLGFSASTTLLRSDFGIDQFGALIGNTINVEIEAEFQRQ
jgi:polyisoprenoid-binding protein YceI